MRRQGEVPVEEKVSNNPPPEAEEEFRRLNRELQVHQAELVKQNAELIQARDELKTALNKCTDLYEFAPVGYVTLDRDGTIVRANLTAERLVGFDRPRLIGSPLALFLTEETRSPFTTFLERVFTTATKETCEVTFHKEGESLLWVQVAGVIAPSGQECRLALIDLTERKHAEEMDHLALQAAEAQRLAEEATESLRHQKEDAEATALARSQFLIHMSHELRTPMTGILGMLQLTLEEDLPPMQREYLQSTLSSARSLLRIINDVLDMAKLEVGTLTIEAHPFSPRSCINEAIDFVTPEVRRKGLDLEISLSNDAPDMVVGDQMRVQQVLTNLIGNAVKFTEKGRVAVEVTAGKPDTEGNWTFTFVVSDTGMGIPDDKKGRLFQAFSQVDPSLNRKYGGTGLGLAISRDIVELMGGTISADSVEGMGSTFTFTIPLAEARLESAANPAVEPYSSEVTAAIHDGKSRLILLTEDDPNIRQVLSIMLKRSNYIVDVAEDGIQAVTKWENGQYDLVLMDVQMPQLDGFAATCAIREKEKERGGHTPVIAMTAHASREDEEKCLAAGMDGYISKPIDFKKSLQVIGAIIGRSTDNCREK